jgi:hypothetical protein
MTMLGEYLLPSLKLGTLGVEDEAVEIEDKRFDHLKVLLALGRSRAVCSIYLHEHEPRSRLRARATLDFFSRDFLDQISKSRIWVAFHAEGDDEKRDQILGANAIRRPLGDLAQIVLRSELFDAHTDDLRQPGGDLLRYVTVSRRKVQTDEGNLKRPIDAFGSWTENYPANGQDRQDGSKQ